MTANQGGFDTIPGIAECKFCGRKSLVERVINGTDHTFATIITCAECIDNEILEAGVKVYGEARWIQLMADLKVSP